MTGRGDEFSRVDAAEPVTDDEADSVQSSIEQSEADRLRSSAETSGATSTHGQTSKPRYAARCRFCRQKFKDTWAAAVHEEACTAEPVAQCRYCNEEHTRGEDPEQHLQSCQPYHSAVQRLAEEEPDEDEEDDPDPGDEEHFLRLFVDPQPHEFHAYLKWDCADLENPLRSYFGLRSLQGEHDFEDHGRLRTAIELDGTEWTVGYNFKDSGIAPRDAHDFRLEEVREYLIYVYPSAYSSWDDAKSEARKRAYFRISPRWPGIESKGEYGTMSGVMNRYERYLKEAETV